MFTERRQIAKENTLNTGEENQTNSFSNIFLSKLVFK